MDSARVNEIDLLRFVAAMAVVLFHYAFRGFAADDMTVLPYPALAPIARYGYFGVELFFMVSGFVILMTASAGGLRRFVLSRFVRLYPAFWACCTLTFVLTLAIGAPRYEATLPQYVANMTMLAGFFDIEPIDGVYWSLYVELKFYLLVAALLLLGRIEDAEQWLQAWLLAVVLLAWLPESRLAALLIVDYAAYFIAGATCYLVHANGLGVSRLLVLLLAYLVAVQQALAKVPHFQAHYRTMLDTTLVAALIAVFFVVMLLVACRRTGPFGRRRWLLAGVVTYPLYLLHANIGFMLFNLGYPALDPHLLFWGTIALMLLLAWVVHVLVERPFTGRLRTLLEGRLARLAVLAGRIPRRPPHRAPP